MRFALLILLAAQAHAAPTIRYDLSFPHASHHEMEVRAVFNEAGAEPLELVMSRSSPGRYAVHEFAKNVSHLAAWDEAGHALAMEHLSPNSWRVSQHANVVVCTYTVFADHADGTYAAVDDTHAHLNMPAVLLWARGWEHVPSQLAFHVPEGSGWKPATQLVPQPDGSWTAPDLEWLMDSPVELSASRIRQWEWHGATLRLAIHQRGTEADAEALEKMCRKVVVEEEAVFGGLPKFDNGVYTFIADFLPYVFGDGMEHRDSTVITSTQELAGSPHQAIGAFSHEFFHAWNVKRIRPRSLEPFDFEHANQSSELWFAEGFTNYYGVLALCRAGIYSQDEFLASMGHAVNAVLNNPGHSVSSVLQMSEMAPFVDAATAIDATNFDNNFISYYTYGQALAFGIDLAIRARFPGKSLDDWMRAMWQEHPDIDHPYSVADLEHTLASTTTQEFAHEIFERNIRGWEPLDYGHLMRAAGFSLLLAQPGRAWLGVTNVAVKNSGLALTGPTLRGSPSYEAGIDEGDELLTCAGTTLKVPESLTECMRGNKPNEKLYFNVQTRVGQRSIAVVLRQDPALVLKSFEQQGLSLDEAATRFRQRWLSSATQ